MSDSIWVYSVSVLCGQFKYVFSTLDKAKEYIKAEAELNKVSIRDYEIYETKLDNTLYKKVTWIK